MSYIVAILSLVLVRETNDRPYDYVTLAMPFNLILSIYPVFLMAMPVNMILVMYVILCILSYDFNKLTMLYIHVHISISMTNKSGLTFFLSIKYLSVCLSVCLFPFTEIVKLNTKYCNLFKKNLEGRHYKKVINAGVVYDKLLSFILFETSMAHSMLKTFYLFISP